MENSIKAKFYMPLLALLLNNVIYTICIIYAHTHTHLTALFLGLPRWAGTRKVRPIWILLKQETVNGSAISWAICKSATRSRQPRQQPTTLFFTGRMPFLPPNQQRQSTEGILYTLLYTNNCIIYTVRETESMWLIKYAYTTFCACIT